MKRVHRRPGHVHSSRWFWCHYRDVVERSPGQLRVHFPKTACRRFAALFWVFPIVALAACGGEKGGDDVSSISAKPSSAPPSSTPDVETRSPCFEGASGDCLTNSELNDEVRRLTEEIKRTIIQNQGDVNWARDAVNAYEGYANLALTRGRSAAASPGAGVRIGFVDNDIHPEHPDFAASETGVTKRFFRLQQEEFVRELVFEPAHGTAVASAAAGLTSGIAWGADLHVLSSGTSQDLISVPNVRAYEDFLGSCRHFKSQFWTRYG